MLSGVLRSKVAVQTSIGVMKAFVAMRRFYFDHAGLVQRVGAIELKQLETDKRIDTVFDALDRGNLLPNGILPVGSEYDSLRYVSRLVESAKSEIVIIDNAELHNLGSSINSLGRRLTTYTTRDAMEIAKILSLLP